MIPMFVLEVGEDIVMGSDLDQCVQSLNLELDTRHSCIVIEISPESELYGKIMEASNDELVNLPSNTRLVHSGAVLIPRKA